MYDIIIRNGTIVDGTGRKAFPGYICIKDGKIAKVCQEQSDAVYPDSAEIYDAQGHIVAPGFIDIHTHSEYSYLATPEMKTSLSAGVTLEVGGNCGSSPVPYRNKNDGRKRVLGKPGLFGKPITEDIFSATDFDEYADNFNSHGCSINLAGFVGHGTLRDAVIGWELRQLTDSELDEMCQLCDKMLSQGAVGVSLGLIYAPGSFCETKELLALGKVVAKHGKVLAVHMRNENNRIFEAIDEMIYVAKETGCRVEISHLKLMGVPQWGRTDELLSKLDRARAAGIRITADQYPYTSSHSGLTSCFPVWSLEGGKSKLTERLKDDSLWQKMLPEVEAITASRGGADHVTVSETESVDYPEIIGKTLTQIAEEMCVDTFEAVRRIMIKCDSRVMCFYNCMSEEDVLKIAARPDICTVTDGTTYDPDCYLGAPHPRNTGSFPRFLRLVRENNLMSMESAVIRVSALPATVICVDDRLGFLKEGYDASITVFDWDNVADKATYTDAAKQSSGIDFVFVNGQLVFDHGSFTGKMPGKFIKV